MSDAAFDELDALPDAAVVERWRALERQRREVEFAEALVIAQVERRGIHGAHGCKSVLDFARFLLNIGAREAAGRIRLSRAVAPLRTITGVPQPPVHPTVAAALESGSISGRAAVVIAKTVDELMDLPDALEPGAEAAVETVLTDFAREHDPEMLQRHAKAVRDRLDQDGRLADHERALRRREATLRRGPDGSGTLTAEVTCELAEYLATMFDCLGRPEPAHDGARDLRTPGQRRHDALLASLRLLFASGRLPDTAGCATTLVLRAEVDQFAAGTGSARTAHGYAVPVEVAKRWLDPEARAILVLLSKTNGIVAYSSTQRLFTEQQRLAMLARDGGCSYWGCDAPAAWTQAHHVTDYRHTHRTRVDDGALVCGANHRTFERMGFRSAMIDGVPHWIPPAWIDQAQLPRRNTLHDW